MFFQTKEWSFLALLSKSRIEETSRYARGYGLKSHGDFHFDPTSLKCTSSNFRPLKRHLIKNKQVKNSYFS